MGENKRSMGNKIATVIIIAGSLGVFVNVFRSPENILSSIILAPIIAYLVFKVAMKFL